MKQKNKLKSYHLIIIALIMYLSYASVGGLSTTGDLKSIVYLMVAMLSIIMIVRKLIVKLKSIYGKLLMNIQN